MPSQRYEGAAAVCDQAESAAPGSVIRPGSAEYQAEHDKSWTPNCWLPTAGFIKPRTAEEVAQVLRAVRGGGGGGGGGTAFAVRCTGHNQNAGVAGVGAHGVVIDVSRLKGLALDDGEEDGGGVLRAGAGCTWGEVYAFLESQQQQKGCQQPHGGGGGGGGGGGRLRRSAVGGRHKDVGVSGFLLGGGMPAFVNLHGYGADNLRWAEVVLADSSIVRASATENPDLFWALKGGGTNFGIVTQFGIQTVPQVRAQYRVNLYSPADLGSIHRATAQLQRTMEADPRIGAYVSFLSKFVAVGLFYAGGAPEDAERAFRPFADLEERSLLLQQAVPSTSGTIESLTHAVGPDATTLRRYAACVVTQVSEELFGGIDRIVARARAAHPKLLDIIYTNQPVSPAAVEIGEARGGNCMGLDKISQSVWVFVAEWTEAEDDAGAEAAVDGVQQAVAGLAERQGRAVRHVFMNDASRKQKVLASYGEANFRRLRETAARYDPDGVFQSLQNDGFLIRRSAV